MLIGTAIGVVAIAVALAWKTEPPIGLPVGDLPPAVAAVEQRSGGSQRYSEIKATPDGVTLFVAVDDQHERALFYRAGALTGPGEAQPLDDRRPFTLDTVDVRRGRAIARDIVSRLGGSKLVELALVSQGGKVVWSLRMQSPRGGTSDWFYTADGQFVGGALK